jgi:hypothetical protein
MTDLDIKGLCKKHHSQTFLGDKDLSEENHGRLRNESQYRTEEERRQNHKMWV